MKAVYALAFALFICSCDAAKENEGMEENETTAPVEQVSSSMAPEAVTTAFATDYPDATATEWEAEGTMYEANFKNGTTDMSAVYTPDGKRFSTEIPISKEMLPAVIIKTAGAMGEITESEQITRADGSISYNVKVADKEYVFDATGSMLEDKGKDDDITDKKAK